MSPSCCCEEAPDCACCSGQTPNRLFLTVTITGSDDCCNKLNDTFELVNSAEQPCIWSYSQAGWCTCDATTYDLSIVAELALNGEDECDLVVTLQLLTPSVDLEIVMHDAVEGTRDCCFTDLSLSLVSFTGSATCDCDEPITMQVDSICECLGCLGTIPSFMQVELSDVANGVCSNCTNLNGTHVLPFAGSESGSFGDGFNTACYWQAAGPDVGPCDVPGTLLQVSIYHRSSDNAVRIQVLIFTAIMIAEKDYAGPIDCSALEDEDIPSTAIGSPRCNNPATSITCLVTAL